MKIKQLRDSEKRRHFILISLSLWLLLFCLPVLAQTANPLLIYAEVDKVEATIGDTITYTLTIDKVADSIKTVPDLENIFDTLEIIEMKKNDVQQVDQRFIEKIIYKLQATAVGSYIIESAKVSYTVPEALQGQYGKDGELKSSKIYIEIKSVLKPDEAKKDIEDIKPLEKIKVINLKIVMAIAGGILLLLLLLLFLLRKKGNKIIEEPVLPAHEQALKSLNKLNAAKLSNEKQIKAFYFKLSEILRQYLKNRFEISAPEQSSEELKQELRQNQEIRTGNKEFLFEFIQKTDLYKYSTITSSQEQARQWLQNTVDFVNATKEVTETKEMEKK